MTVRRSVRIVSSIVSPARISLDGLTRTSFRCTRPPRTASVAAPRVLKKRAAQSHLSIRTSFMTAMIAAVHIDATPLGLVLSVMSAERQRVVVVGGGFGGLQAVRKLRRAPVDITLIDRRNFHLF